MTAEEKENISTLIKSKEGHELGLTLAKSSGYIDQYLYDYKLDCLSYRASFEENYHNQTLHDWTGDTLTVNKFYAFRGKTIYIWIDFNGILFKRKILMSDELKGLHLLTCDKSNKIDSPETYSKYVGAKMMFFRHLIEVLRDYEHELNDIISTPETI